MTTQTTNAAPSLPSGATAHARPGVATSTPSGPSAGTFVASANSNILEPQTIECQLDVARQSASNQKFNAKGRTKALRKPSAAARTVSLFTGKSDVEAPRLGRDGSAPDAQRRAPRTLVKHTWVEGVGRFTCKTLHVEILVMPPDAECPASTYVLMRSGLRIGDYDSLTSAVIAAEAP